MLIGVLSVRQEVVVCSLWKPQ